MIRLVALVLLLLGSVLQSRAQVPAMELPELREGVDTLWLDSTLLPVKKSSASYFVFTLYHLDQDVWTIKTPWRRKGFRFYPQFNLVGKVGSPVALSGQFEWRNKQGVLMAREEFYNGAWSGLTTICNKRGEVQKTIDYAKRWDNETWSYYVEEYAQGVVSKAAFEKYDSNRFRWLVLCTQGCQVSRDFR